MENYKYEIKKIFVIITIVLLATTSLGQTISVYGNFVKDTLINPFNGYDKAYSLKINGTIKLATDSSLIRVILIDQYSNHYLLYEAYPLITLSDTFYIHEGCEETCFMDGILLSGLKIEVINASLNLDTIQIIAKGIQDVILKQTQVKNINDSIKISILNREIQRSNMYWLAGKTNIQDMSFQEKENYFGLKYNLCGFDFYVGGIFELQSFRNYTPKSSVYVNEFDWRNRHGANNPLSPYFDSDSHSEKSGWLTEIRDQGNCGSCYIFAAIGEVEARANIYYNAHYPDTKTHLDLNLSEQQIISCPNPSLGGCNGGWVSPVLYWLTNNKVTEESCFPVDALSIEAIDCELCADYSQRIKVGITSMNTGNWDEETTKHNLINSGPLGVMYSPINHALLLCAYQVTNSGDFLYEINGKKVYVPEDASVIGTTTWIFKNSWGYGNSPYYYINSSIIPFYSIAKINGPLTMENFTLNIKCSDEDGDGYYWWGNSQTTPCSTCPAGIDQKEDCDDFNRDSGPYNVTSYECTSNCDALDQTFTYPEGIITNLIVDEHQKRHVIIPAGATLNVSCNIYMAPGRKITIEKGGKLILTSNGKITSACTQLWQGIEVEGTNLAQSAANQGSIEIQTGGIIENAICGIKTILLPLQQESGGIIKATGGIFRNNRTAVNIMNYGGIINSTLFKIDNCTFETEGVLLDGSAPVDFIKLENLSNSNCIKVQGCSFTETDNLRKISGIRAYNAFFQCIKNGSIPTTFSNLLYGIYGSSSFAPSPAIIVDECHFINTYRSIYLSGCEVPQITSNTINVPNIDAHWIPVEGFTAYGIYLDASTAYKVEDNNIFSDSYGDQLPIYINTCGIYVRNSGAEANEIYRNSFNNLRCGIASFGINRNGINTGLNLKCNTYTGCGTDIGVYRGTLPLTANIGIRRDQGDYNTTDPAKSAGNVFSSLSYQYHTNDINNSTCMPIRYNHHKGISIPGNVRMIPVPLISPGVEIHENILSTYSPISSCPSNPGKSGGDGAMLVQKADSLQIEIDELELTLLQNIDGGSTAETIEDILYSAPDETYSVYSDLLEKSPYLSDTVMKNAVMREDLLPEVMLRDILVANPQAAKSDTLYNALESRVVPLNDTLMGDIMSNAEVYGDKELLEMQRAEAEQQYGYILNQRIANIISDTTVLQKTDSLINIYSFSNRLTDKYSLSLLYSAQGNANSSAIIMEEIGNKFYLTNFLQEEYNQYQAWISIVNRANSNNHNLTFDSIQVNNLQAMLAIDSLNLFLPTVLARNVLVNAGIHVYREPLIFDSEFKSASIRKGYPKILIPSNTTGYLKVYPNPAKNYLIVEYLLPENCPQGIFKVTSVEGKLIKHIILNSARKEIAVPTDDFPTQVIISILSGDKLIGNKKVIISK
jgi:hypothetical protein